MHTRTTHNRPARRLMAAVILGGGLLIGFSPPANAAVTASFLTNDQLSVVGDSLDNTITISRNSAGQILVNGGAVKILGGTATVANTKLIQVFGQTGNDTITIVETSGALPRADLFGGAGNDVLTGGSAADQLFGQSGNDTTLGKGGNDLIFGGTENDTLTGGDADDQVFGDSGDDRIIWNPGDDTDLDEGGGGIDTIEVNGGNGAEIFSATANGTRVRFDRSTPGPFTLDIGTSEKLVLNALGGDDKFSAAGNLAGLIAVTVDAGAGNDTVVGTTGNDVLLGGDGNDLLDGQQGNDVVFLGAGDDRFNWDPGDGSDTIEGQDGRDEVEANGSAISERFEASANGARVRFTRDVAAILLDLNDVEIVDVNTLGGTDLVTVNDLAATDVSQVEVDLAGTLAGTSGDAQADNVVVSGTVGDDVIELAGSTGSASVVGLAAPVTITGTEAANDRVTVNALNGDDLVDGSDLTAAAIKFSANGGDGADVLIGGSGNDTLLGGAGDDVLVGGPGTDVLDGQTGDNTVIHA
jgi:Ca2+-binding RTX toxin-like protein